MSMSAARGRGLRGGSDPVRRGGRGGPSTAVSAPASANVAGLARRPPRPRVVPAQSASPVLSPPPPVCESQ